MPLSPLPRSCRGLPSLHPGRARAPGGPAPRGWGRATSTGWGRPENEHQVGQPENEHRVGRHEGEHQVGQHENKHRVSRPGFRLI
ncbi:hypothetical protein I79_015499 [Cricetulus griseus]|uniref:Uncharacterized protein n=1 Tax=Cricetulus griseus TaxID=10029 RepID=G3HWY4_CRIGR|nr:hypothetical protein I79_015499 [Cricetulus griseus]